MAQKIKEYYVCDKCKKEIEDYSIKVNHVCDSFNAYFYDLCSECKDAFDKYDCEIKTLRDQAEKLTEKYMFGRYMFKDGKDE